MKNAPDDKAPFKLIHVDPYMLTDVIWLATECVRLHYDPTETTYIYSVTDLNGHSISGLERSKSIKVNDAVCRKCFDTLSQCSPRKILAYRQSHFSELAVLALLLSQSTMISTIQRVVPHPRHPMQTLIRRTELWLFTDFDPSFRDIPENIDVTDVSFDNDMSLSITTDQESIHRWGNKLQKVRLLNRTLRGDEALVALNQLMSTLCVNILGLRLDNNDSLRACSIHAVSRFVSHVLAQRPSFTWSPIPQKIVENTNQAIYQATFNVKPNSDVKEII